MGKVRIDRLIAARGLAPSRERAQAIIMAGAVLVDGRPIDKAGTMVDDGARVEVRGDDNPYVSRGGLKLEGALDDLGVAVVGKVVLDVGASTGGFTDCCLKRGARRVFAVDVGTNQLDFSLRRDPRVLCLEKTNARALTPTLFPEAPELAVIDVSFISLTLILGPTLACLAEAGEILAMVKPQFEAGRDKVGKGGVVRDEGVREEAIAKVAAYAQVLGLECAGRADSRLLGPKGNRETFLRLVRRRPASAEADAGC
jgi:23S rRNA (cytidine1920-2'-O)/16S rRNA (cytidine1409-2'-O)-methyltransferase